ncbi:fumarylacetoacetate hydrolase family protein [Bacillus sp. SJS]|uniref:fumarylacetoacetate hydrolase family protein n=1 Tax=Bacillus sp. SJS TaxID=1423321 RepID=UPI0004DCC34B|nr:fumarylacetoacetate hydrolase family protein [Bacillus sp. SJS]KZZ83651.1 2-hydroxyhepta-2,4-diene-1,7-dioate isomerase [Bacillus sp. SJS]
MKRARVAYAGAVHEAVESNGDVKLDDGRLVKENEVVWLPPVNPRTVFALGLNYADHAKELDFQAPPEPLIFLKGPHAFVGHRGQSRRPAGAEYMHYECELAVVIGKKARHVKREEAYQYVKGYTIANDYAIRDYLENYFRPNLRVKNRDGCTPIGPWLTDAADITDPMNLALRTFVNGKLTQEGNTRDMVFGIRDLIEYLSRFMTLEENDIILTGTPEGLSDTAAGDIVVTEIEGIGRLENTVVSDEVFGIQEVKKEESHASHRGRIHEEH